MSRDTTSMRKYITSKFELLMHGEQGIFTTSLVLKGISRTEYTRTALCWTGVMEVNPAQVKLSESNFNDLKQVQREVQRTKHLVWQV